jgi:hypothetical protein
MKRAFTSIATGREKIILFGLFFSLAIFNFAKSEAKEFERNKDVQFLGIESYRDVDIANWAENVKFRPEVVFLPKTKNDLITIVNDAAKHGKRITIIGKGHSWNPLMEGSDYLVSTINLNKVWLNSEDNTVTVESGATIKQVDEIIEPQGYVVSCNIVGTTDITYGGIMATGSHGSGRDCPTMSDYIEEIEFIRSDGRVEVVSEASHGSQIMNAARLNLGLFGIMYKIKFRVEKSFNAEVIDQRVPLEELFKVLPDYLQYNQNVELLWFPFSPEVVIKSWNRTAESKREGSLGSRIETRLTKSMVYGSATRPIIKFIMKHFPNSVPSLTKTLSKGLFPNAHYIVGVNQAIHYVNEAVAYPINETEVAVPYDFDDLGSVKMGWDAMIKAVYDNAARGHHPLNIVVHMRFLKSSNAILSPAYRNKRTCYMDYGSYYQTPGWLELVNEIWSTWKYIPGVRLHWAKDMRAYKDLDIHRMYGAENVRDFLKVRNYFDPSGMFANDFIRGLFEI